MAGTEIRRTAAARHDAVRPLRHTVCVRMRLVLFVQAIGSRKSLIISAEINQTMIGRIEFFIHTQNKFICIGECVRNFADETSRGFACGILVVARHLDARTI